ncbi:MAG: hypothetical protein WCX30_01180 [Candidatus Paceibacterota bacterium]|jgi:hypothetical protein|nr:hypothetical protein [bacterium]
MINYIFKRAFFVGLFLFFIGFCPAVNADTIGQRVSFIVEPQYSSSGLNKTNAVLVKAGSGLYFYLEESFWNSKKESEKSDIISTLEGLDKEFISNIKPKLNSAFGTENTPGIDNDVKITILFYPLKGSARGYVRNVDEYSRFTNPASNEREIVYLNSEYIQSNYLKEFFTHEYMHLITMNQKELQSDGHAEEVWLAEAFSEYAISYVGYNNKENSYIENRINVFVNNPSNSLNEWGNDIADYGMVSIFSNYLVEKYGIKVLSDAIRSKKTGIDSINESLVKNGYKETFQKIFTDFTVAVYLNDCNVSEKFCFRGAALKDMHVFTMNNFLPSSGESNLFLGQSISNYSAQWQKFIGGTGDIKFKFKGPPNGYSSVYYIIKKPNDEIIVDYLRLSSVTKEGEVVIKGVGKNVLSIIFIPSIVTFNTTDTSSKYYYSLSASTFVSTPTVQTLPISIDKPLSNMTKDELINVLLRLLYYLISQQQMKYSTSTVVY